MATADLATLVVAMEANTAKFQKDMERVDRRMDQFARNSKRTADTVGAAFAGIRVAALVGSMTAFVKMAANNVSQQKALAESAGLSVSAFSALNYAARQSELSQEDLGRALFRVNTVMGDAAAGNEKAAATLAKFGISVEDVRSGAVGSEQALRRIADVFNALPAGVNKSSLAADLLGDKLGAKLIPFLSHGSAGLDEFARKGEAVGAVMNDKVADAVARANDRLSAFAQTLQTQVLVGLASFFGLVEANAGDKALEELAQQIGALEGELSHLIETASLAEQGGFLGALFHTDDAARIAEIRNELAALNRERDKLKQAQLDRLSQPAPGRTPVAAGPDKEAQRRMAQHARDLERMRGEVLLLNDAEGEAAKMRALVNELYAKGKIPQDAYLAFVEEASQRLDDLNIKTDESARSMSAMADQAARNIQSFTASMVDAALAGEDLGDAVVASLRRIAAEMLTMAILEGIGGAMSKSGNGFLSAIGGFLSGKRAEGGPVSGGGTYLVGEQGPELFVPRTSGAIVPNGGWGGGGEVSVHIDARGADAASAANIMRIAPTLTQRIKAEIYEEQRRGYAPA